MEHVGELEVELEAATEAGVFAEALEVFRELVNGVGVHGRPLRREIDLAPEDDAPRLSRRSERRDGYFGRVKRPKPIRTCRVLSPGLYFVRLASEMCIKRISALQLYLCRRNCRPKADDVVKLIGAAPRGTS